MNLLGLGLVGGLPGQHPQGGKHKHRNPCGSFHKWGRKTITKPQFDMGLTTRLQVPPYRRDLQSWKISVFHNVQFWGPRVLGSWLRAWEQGLCDEFVTRRDVGVSQYTGFPCTCLRNKAAFRGQSLRMRHGFAASFGELRW